MSNTHTAYIEADGSKMELAFPGVDGSDQESIAELLERQLQDIQGVKDVEVIVAP